MRPDPRLGGLPLLVRTRRLTVIFITGLVLSGAVAIRTSPVFEAALSGDAFSASSMFSRTDWLAFGQFMFALSFVGAVRDPVRNRWSYQFGMTVCALVPVWALVFGLLRGTPLQWQLVDVSFGAIGFIPMWLCNRWARALELRGRRVTDP